MRRLTTGALAALLLPALVAAQPAPAPARTRVAVLDLRPIGVEAPLAELLSEIALTEAAALPYLDVIGRSDIQAMLGFERQKKILGCEEDSACIAEIGGALGVRLVLVGSVGKIGTLYRLDLKVIDTGRAGAVRRRGVNVEGAEEKMVAAVQGAVRELFQPEAKAAGAPAAEAAPAPGPALAAPPPAQGAPAAAPAALAASPAPAHAPRWTLGLRLAAGVPGGEFQKDTEQTDLMGAQGVFQLDASYRIAERLHLGLFFSYGAAQPGKEWESDCEQDGITCTVSSSRLGLSLRYDLAGAESRWVPFVGVGTGFEVFDFVIEGDAAKATVSASGWEPLSFEAGLDVRLGAARLGPYAGLALGRYSEVEFDLTELGGGRTIEELDKAVHTTFHVGLRAALEL